MTTTEKIVFGLAAVVIAVMAYAGLNLPVSQVMIQAGSPVGTTFNTAKIAAINITPSSASATSTSILNSDASDRTIVSTFVSCSAAGSVQTQALAGVATWNWTFATTSTSAPTLIGNTNHIADMVVATSSTDDSYVASSTPPALVVNRRWKSGSYLTIIPNATSSTAVCTAGANYIAQ